MKVKLILSFIITLIALLTIAYFGRYTINTLIDSIREESMPNIRLERLRDLQSDLLEVENSVRTFTITKDVDDLTSYYRTISQLDTRMNDLYTLSVNAADKTEVDEIGKLIDQKLNVLNEIVGMSDDDRINEVLQKVLLELEEFEEVQDQSYAEVDINKDNTNIKIPTAKDTTTLVKEIEEPKYGFFKRLFSSGNRKKKNDKKEEDIDLSDKSKEAPAIHNNTSDETDMADSTQVQDLSLQLKDSLSTMITDVDSLPDESVEGIIQKIENEEEQRQRIKTAQELKLIQRDKSISDEIRKKISSMENMEQQRFLMRAQNAEYNVNKTQKIVLITMISTTIIFLILLAIILNDIAKLYRQRKELKQATLESDRLAIVKQEFLSNVSHEIRTPLTAILGFADQLKGTKLQPDQTAHLSKIWKSSEHLMMLINDILDLSKIEKGKLDLECITFEPSKEITDSIDILKPSLKIKNLDLLVDIKSLDGIILNGDPFRYRQILFNLLGNAIKFTEKGRVEVRCTAFRDGKSIRLKTIVKDTGIGISDDQLPHIFENFTQVDTSNSRQYDGTGLGLSIAKNLVEIQNGFIRVRSKQGEGSVFTFEIPYIPGNKEDLINQQQITETPQKNHPSQHLLIVDDSEYNLELISAILKKSKIAVTKATSGKEALLLLGKNNFDAVLLDIQMPGMSGLEVIEHFRKDHGNSTLKFVAVTANPEPETVTTLKSSGFEAVIPKPFTFETLHRILDPILSSLPTWSVQSPEQDIPAANTSNPYNLDELLELSDGNIAFQINMLDLFLKNMDENIEIMSREIERNDLDAAAATAHKAVPPCRHLKIYSMVDKLKLIEQTCKQNLPDIPGINYQALEFDWKSIRPMLEKDLDEIKRKFEKN